jgi:putative transcriptional regulator
MKELTELGERIRRQRIAMQVKQADLAEKAAVSIKVIIAVENGRSITTESLVRILRSLGYAEALANILPPPAISPIDLQKLAGKQRQRVR